MGSEREDRMAVKRLDRILSELGVASRSELRGIIKSGRVRVNGETVTAPETRIDADTAVIALDGRELRNSRYRYFMMDKPPGVLCATEDRSQKTVLDLLPAEMKRLRLFPVGRLDKDTSGLLLLTNDGVFAHRVISPGEGVEKRYLAELEYSADPEDVRAFAEGITLSDGTKCLPAKLELSEGCRCFVTVTEGKYHQVKRMLASRGKPVKTLRRLSIGKLEIDPSLGAGGIRELDERDLCKVLDAYHIGI